MNNYTENFTLTDIFNNKELEGKLPLINYRDYMAITPEGSKFYNKTSVQTIRKQIFDGSIHMARFYYKPLKVVKSRNMLILDGNLVYDHDSCVNDIYDNLVGMKPMLSYTANNVDMIRSAIKEAEKNKRLYGLNSKLFLRQQSMMEIKGLTNRQRQNFMNDVMSNILFGDNFPITQKKFKVSELNYGQKDYATLRKAWREKVGI